MVLHRRRSWPGQIITVTGRDRGRESEKDIQGQRHRDATRERERESERQTDRQIETERHRETERG